MFVLRNSQGAQVIQMWSFDLRNKAKTFFINNVLPYLRLTKSIRISYSSNQLLFNKEKYKLKVGCT